MVPFDGLVFGGAYIRRGLSMEGNLRFNIDRASLLVGSKFSVFVLFYLVFEGNFLSTSRRGAYIWRGDLTDGFLRYRFGGLILEGLIFGILRYYTQFSIILSNLLLFTFNKYFGDFIKCLLQTNFSLFTGSKQGQSKFRLLLGVC